jgi:hypothetical protein
MLGIIISIPFTPFGFGFVGIFPLPPLPTLVIAIP